MESVLQQIQTIITSNSTGGGGDPASPQVFQTGNNEIAHILNVLNNQQSSSSSSSSSDNAKLVSQIIRISLLPCLNMGLVDSRVEVKDSFMAYLEFVLTSSLVDVDLRINAVQPLLDAIKVFLRRADDSASVVVPVFKRAILCANHIYHAVFKLIALNPTTLPNAPWNTLLSELKSIVTKCMDVSNDGVKPHVIKFMQLVILQQSFSDPSAEADAISDISLDLCPTDHPYLKRTELLEEADLLLTELVSFVHSTSLSGPMMSAAVNALFPIAKSRPQYLPKIVESLLSWTRNVPSHLSSLQVKSVERAIRTALLPILGFKAAEMNPYVAVVSELLIALGAKGYEVAGKVKSRAEKQGTTAIKRSAPAEDSTSSSSSSSAKRFKQDDEQMNLIQSIPVEVIVELILRSAAMTPQAQWDQAVMTYRASLGLPPAPAAPAVPVPVTTVRRAANRADPRLKNQLTSPAAATPTSAAPLTTTTTTTTSTTSSISALFGGADILSLVSTNQLTPAMIAALPPLLQAQIHQELAQKQLELQLALQQGLLGAATGAPGGLIKPDTRLDPLGRPIPPPPSILASPVLQEPEFDADTAVLEDVRTPMDARRVRNEAVMRILEQEPLFSAPILAAAATSSNEQQTATNSTTTTSTTSTSTTSINLSALAPLDPKETFSAAKHAWMLMVTRLVSLPSSSSIEKTGGAGNLGDAQVPSDAQKDVDDDQEEDDGLQSCLVDFVLEDFRSRYDLALLWLYETFKVDSLKNATVHDSMQVDGDSSPAAGSNSSAKYPALFHRLLAGLKGEARTESSPSMPGLDPKDRFFTKFLIDVPELTHHALTVVVKSYCEDPERMPLGLATLRDLINLRPANQKICFDMLMDYCLSPARSTRTKAILISKQWVSPFHPVLGHQVQDFALSCFNKLQGPPPTAEGAAAAHRKQGSGSQAVPDSSRPGGGGGSLMTKHSRTDDVDLDEDVGGDQEMHHGGGVHGIQEEEEHEWSEAEVLRHAELYFALCSKKHDLLSELFNSWSKLPPVVTGIILKSVTPLIKSMANAPSRLHKFIREFPSDSSVLVKKIIGILASESRAERSAELVQAVLETVRERKLDASFILDVLPLMEKDAVLKVLPDIVLLLNGSLDSKEIVRGAFRTLIADPAEKVNAHVSVPENTNTKGPILTPIELVVAIHNLQEPVTLKGCYEATELCLTQPEVFTQEILASSVQQLVEQSKIPVLVMKTLMSSVKLFPSLANFVYTILAKLITKKVWSAYPHLWEGFIRCCMTTAPGSFQVLITLPPTQLEDVLTRAPALKPKLHSYLLELPTKMKSRVKKILALVAPAEESAVSLGGGGDDKAPPMRRGESRDDHPPRRGGDGDEDAGYRRHDSKEHGSSGVSSDGGAVVRVVERSRGKERGDKGSGDRRRR